MKSHANVKRALFVLFTVALTALAGLVGCGPPPAGGSGGSGQGNEDDPAEDCQQTFEDNDAGESCDTDADCAQLQCDCEQGVESSVSTCEEGTCTGLSDCDEHCEDQGGWVCSGMCLGDDDCQITELCYAAGGADSYEPMTCVPRCAGDADCADGEACLPRDDGEDAGADDTICLPSDEPEGCTGDGDCPDGHACQIPVGEQQGNCVPETTDGYTTVRISDGGDLAMDGTYGYDTAGAALYEIALLDELGVVAHATAVDYRIGADNNFNVLDDAGFIFDGTDPGFGASCPSMDDNFQNASGADRESNFTYNQVVILGNGGELSVQFFDGGTPIELGPNHSVEIFSYGHECGFVHADEKWGAATHGWSDCDDVHADPDGAYFCPRSAYADYEVSLCTEEDGDCDVFLGTGHGHVEIFDVQ